MRPITTPTFFTPHQPSTRHISSPVVRVAPGNLAPYNRFPSTLAPCIYHHHHCTLPSEKWPYDCRLYVCTRQHFPFPAPLSKLNSSLCCTTSITIILNKKPTRCCLQMARAATLYGAFPSIRQRRWRPFSPSSASQYPLNKQCSCSE